MSKVARKKKIKPPMLLTAVLKDVFKTHLTTLILAVAILISAFGLIVLSHNQRNLYADLEQLHIERNDLDVKWRELRMEQRMLAEHARLEEVATQKLGMKNLDVKSERIVKQINEDDD